MTNIPKHLLDLELKRLREKAAKHEMTIEKIEALRQSWVRGMTGRCEHGVIDFEQCPYCRDTARMT